MEIPTLLRALTRPICLPAMAAIRWVTLNLTVSPAITSTVNEAICQGQTFAFNGTTYSTAGSFTGTFSSTGGCDSIVTLNLTVNPTATTALNQSICTGQSYSFNGNTYTTAGTYTANLLTSNGCDSVVTLNLTVSPAITSTINEAICQGQNFRFQRNYLFYRWQLHRNFRQHGRLR